MPQAPQRRVAARRRRSLLASLGLRRADQDALTIRRLRHGTGWRYLDARGRSVRDKSTLQRLRSLAVPPAYEDVRYAADPAAHLQAVGRDAAGRLQYRYHPDWNEVREYRKARRLARLAASLPRIRRRLQRALAGRAPTRALALAAVIDLVSRSAIRAGRQTYLKQRGTRGAATLLKSNVALSNERIRLRFRSKGGKIVVTEVCAPRLAAALRVLQRIPGARLFQYRADDGSVRPVRAREVNEFLREIAASDISLKDFRTLVASAGVLETLATLEPAPSARQRRRQVLAAIRQAAETLHNTPAICRKSYAHATVIAAFEAGALKRFSEMLAKARSPARREAALVQVVAAKV